MTSQRDPSANSPLSTESTADPKDDLGNSDSQDTNQQQFIGHSADTQENDNHTDETSTKRCDDPETPNRDRDEQTNGDLGSNPRNAGGVLAASTESRAHAKTASRVFRRLNREGRWKNLEPLKDEMIVGAKAQGMPAEEAREWAYSELDRLYPPLPPKKTKKEEAEESKPEAATVSGLGEIPLSWGKLPANSKQSIEVQWVQANRLLVVEEKPGGSTVVDLSKADSPAPSMGALGWLETSIRTYAKYVDVVGKSLATSSDETEQVRRERMAIEEIRSLLAEMHED